MRPDDLEARSRILSGNPPGGGRPDELAARHRRAYDAAAAGRDTRPLPRWKHDERRRVLGRLIEERATEVLEIGAGTGRDAQVFAEAGLSMTCVDLSPASVRLCQEKGLSASVMDFAHLSFVDERFDAVYGLNCLLHVPTDHLPPVLREIRRVLRPEGLFYLGTYGGYDEEGIYENDSYRPRRFFSFHSEAALRTMVEPWFAVVWFHSIDDVADGPRLRFQSLLLRRTVTEQSTTGCGTCRSPLAETSGECDA